MLPQLSTWPLLIRMVQGEGSLPSPLRPAGQLRGGPAALGSGCCFCLQARQRYLCFVALSLGQPGRSLGPSSFRAFDSPHITQDPRVSVSRGLLESVVALTESVLSPQFLELSGSGSAVCKGRGLGRRPLRGGLGANGTGYI